MTLAGLLILVSGICLVILASLPAVNKVRTFESWRLFKDFRFLWVGSFFANSAQWLQLLSIGWLVRALTVDSSSSAFLIVAVGGISTLPVLIFGPVGGVLGDRLDRRKVVIAIQAFMAAVAILFAVLIHSARVEWWHAYIYVILGGVCWSITLPLRQALIANTVPRESVVNAYASIVITITGTRILGPVFGGVLITVLGFTWNFALEAALYIGTVIALLPMKTPYATATSGSTAGSPLADLKEGIRYIWKGERVIFDLIVLGLIPNVVLHPVWFMLPIFTVEVLHRNADVGGYLLAVTGAGGLVASLVVASAGFVFKKSIICFGSIILSSVCVILFAQSQWLPAAIVFMGLMSFAQSIFRTAAGSQIQLLAPDHLRGRISSLELYSQGFLIFTSLIIGWFVGITTVVIALMVVGGLGLALGTVSIFTLPRVRQLD